jgi:hypothetical protein
MQIVETKKLREEDGGVWLRDLRGDLKREELRGIIERGQGMPEGTPLAAYLYMVVGANKAEYKELVEMSNAFEEAMEECGFVAKWEARAREESKKEIARNALREGMAPGAISKITGLSIAMVKRLAKEPANATNS